MASSFDTIRVRVFTIPKPPWDFCSYPMQTIAKGQCLYIVHENVPLLLTLFASQEEETFASEGVVLSTHELFFSFFLMLGNGPIYLGDYSDVNLKKIGINMENINELLQDRTKFSNILKEIQLTLQPCKLVESNMPYMGHMNHPLTKSVIFTRITFALLKANMLCLTSNLLYEEACLNIFIALEGLIHLLHRRYYPEKIFCFTDIKELFQKLLDDGDCFFEWLKEEVREDRHCIVHPQVADDFEIYFPVSSGEDFAENRQYAFALVKFLLDEDVNKLRQNLG